jgi:hypothetical protein
MGGPNPFSFSFIRTVTVGPGVPPDLLTLSLAAKALAGCDRRWGISPRPENTGTTPAQSF